MAVPVPQADPDLTGAEIVSGPMSIGRVQSVQRDPVSGRVRRLVTRYGALARIVAVPVEWVVHSSPTRVSLGVSPLLLDDLPEQN